MSAKEKPPSESADVMTEGRLSPKRVFHSVGVAWGKFFGPGRKHVPAVEPAVEPAGDSGRRSALPRKSPPKEGGEKPPAAEGRSKHAASSQKTGGRPRPDIDRAAVEAIRVLALSRRASVPAKDPGPSSEPSEPKDDRGPVPVVADSALALDRPIWIGPKESDFSPGGSVDRGGLPSPVPGAAGSGEDSEPRVPKTTEMAAQTAVEPCVSQEARESDVLVPCVVCPSGVDPSLETGKMETQSQPSVLHPEESQVPAILDWGVVLRSATVEGSRKDEPEEKDPQACRTDFTPESGVRGPESGARSQGPVEGAFLPPGSDSRDSRGRTPDKRLSAPYPDSLLAEDVAETDELSLAAAGSSSLADVRDVRPSESVTGSEEVTKTGDVTKNGEVTKAMVERAAFFSSVDRTVLAKALVNLKPSVKESSRIEAIRSLSQVRHELSLRAISHQLAEDCSPRVRAECVNTLTALAAREAEPAIASALLDPAPAVRLAAVRALYRLMGQSSSRLLICVLADEDENVRHRAGTCLGWLWDRSLLTDLQPFLMDTCARVRQVVLGGSADLPPSRRLSLLVDGVVEEAFRLFDNSDEWVRDRALRLLRLVSGQKTSSKLPADPIERQAMIDRWRAWWVNESRAAVHGNLPFA